MVLAGHDVQSIVESNVYKGLEANLQIYYLETNMSNGTYKSKREMEEEQNLLT